MHGHKRCMLGQSAVHIRSEAHPRHSKEQSPGRISLLCQLSKNAMLDVLEVSVVMSCFFTEFSLVNLRISRSIWDDFAIIMREI